MKPSCSVVMPARNAGTTISSAVRSLRPSHEVDVDLVLVDDGSTDDTVERALSAARVPVRVVRHDESLGVGAALNSGIQHASGDYVARLDSDDLSLAARVPRHVHLLRSHPEVDFVAGHYQYIGPTGRRLATPAPPESGAGDQIALILATGTNPICHPAVTTRRATLEGDGYPPLIYEDYALWMTSCLRGNRWILDSEPVTQWRLSSRSASFSNVSRGKDELVPLLRSLWRDLLGEDLEAGAARSLLWPLDQSPADLSAAQQALDVLTARSKGRPGERLIRRSALEWRLGALRTHFNSVPFSRSSVAFALASYGRDIPRRQLQRRIGRRRP